jgi:hypothetical protein
MPTEQKLTADIESTQKEPTPVRKSNIWMFCQTIAQPPERRPFDQDDATFNYLFLE